jgi:pimeloyl-ACP methyl ester carboxylesterase
LSQHETRPTKAMVAAFAADEVADLRLRLSRVRLPQPEVVDDWRQGVPINVMRRVLDHWRDAYDMTRIPDRLNAFDNVSVVVNGVSIHLIHARSPHPNARPLVLVHGWPGSVMEFDDVIGPLTDPTRDGGDPADAFHVIVPSLPGFGFSAAPTVPGWGTDAAADAVVAAVLALGYERFGTQGGDWGSTVALKAGHRHPRHVTGVHVNFGYADPAAIAGLGELTDDEAAMIRHAPQASGHVAVQSTVPQTLGYGLADSPAGQAAWILDKVHAWSDPSTRLSIDRALDLVTLYWMTNTGATSARLYWEGPLGWLGVVDEVPVGYTRFPHDTHQMSERMARTRFPRLAYYDRAPHGGHFAAAEVPAQFVRQVRRAFRSFGI